MLYGKIGVTYVYNFALRKFRGQWSATQKKTGAVVWQWEATSKSQCPPLGGWGGWRLDPGGAGTPTHWQCVATLHCRCFPHSLPAH